MLRHDFIQHPARQFKNAEDSREAIGIALPQKLISPKTTNKCSRFISPTSVADHEYAPDDTPTIPSPEKSKSRTLSAGSTDISIHLMAAQLRQAKRRECDLRIELEAALSERDRAAAKCDSFEIQLRNLQKALQRRKCELTHNLPIAPRC